MPSDRDAWTQFVETGRGARVPVLGPRVEARHKYGARAITVDGFHFDSMKEAARYQELKLMAAAGTITDLELQPRFPLQVMALYRPGPPWVIEHLGFYTADFRYTDHTTGEIVIEDTKSDPTKTESYRLRKRIVEAVHGITIREL